MKRQMMVYSAIALVAAACATPAASAASGCETHQHTRIQVRHVAGGEQSRTVTRRVSECPGQAARVSVSYSAWGPVYTTR